MLHVKMLAIKAMIGMAWSTSTIMEGAQHPNACQNIQHKEQFYMKSSQIPYK